MDKHDRMRRVENLFRNVPTRSWTDGKFKQENFIMIDIILINTECCYFWIKKIIYLSITEQNVLKMGSS